MRSFWRSGFAIVILISLTWMFAGCNSRSRAQTQAQQDQEERERVAKATEEARHESEKAALQVEQAARQAEHQAKVAGQGVKEGWNRDNNQGRLDLNTATGDELRALSLSQAQIRQIIDERPYRTPEDLVTRGILTQADYQNIRDHVTVKP
jgi:DNA uptake protein ComE-like DNA-binding protein